MKEKELLKIILDLELLKLENKKRFAEFQIQMANDLAENAKKEIERLNLWPTPLMSEVK